MSDFMIREAGDNSAERFRHDGDCCPPPVGPLAAVAALDLAAAFAAVLGVVAFAHLTDWIRRVRHPHS